MQEFFGIDEESYNSFLEGLRSCLNEGDIKHGKKGAFAKACKIREEKNAERLS